MLRQTRRIAAAASFVLITLLLLDVSGVLHRWLGWLAKVQIVPAVMAVNVTVLVVLALLTLLFGRIYCSVICPLGIMQDGVSHLSGRRKGKKNRFSHSKALSWLRYGALALFVAAMVAGISVAVSLLDPYAAYGRVAGELLSPLYRLGNNLLAWAAEKAGSYALYPVEVWIKSGVTFGVALLTLAVTALLAWHGGRTWCNTVCPVGTLLGLVSRFSIFRPAFDTAKCTACGLCEKKCKSSCIDSGNMTIDRSRCVTCFNCIEACKSGAMKYTACRSVAKPVARTADETAAGMKDGFSRRSFLTIAGAAAVTGTIKAQQLKVDGGLADIEDKKMPARKTPVVPPGAEGAAHMKARCTACLLCVSACPEHILRPSTAFPTLMQPEMSFERGYCRPECTECSQVCPSGAIKPTSAADKTAVSIGLAVWIADNCIVHRDNVPCTACERHCPTGAVTLVPIEPDKKNSLKTPVVDKQLCIGCGACEYLCPARPFSAIYVEGNVRHHTV